MTEKTVCGIMEIWIHSMKAEGMKGGMCVMAHQDTKNDIEAAGRKLQIRNSTVDSCVY